MAEMETDLRLFEITLYDASDKADDKDEWNRRRSIWVAAKTMEAAQALARKKLKEDEVLTEAREMINTEFVY